MRSYTYLAQQSRNLLRPAFISKLNGDSRDRCHSSPPLYKLLDVAIIRIVNAFNAMLLYPCSYAVATVP